VVDRTFMRVGRGISWRIGRPTGWEEVDIVLGIILSTIDFSYKLMRVSHRFTGPSRVCYGLAIRYCIDAHVVSWVVSSEVHRRLGHARLQNRHIEALRRVQ